MYGGRRGVVAERPKFSKARRRSLMKALVVAIVAVVALGLVAGYVLAADQKPAGKPQTTRPIMGGRIDKKVFVDYEGKRIYFCCNMCPPEFMKDPAKHIKKMEEAGIVLEKAPAREK